MPWRVETLQKLETYEEDIEKQGDAETITLANEDSKATAYLPDSIGKLLKERCEDTQLYLQHELTLQQLSLAIGTTVHIWAHTSPNKALPIMHTSIVFV